MKIPKTITIAGVRLKIVRRNLTDAECYGHWHEDKRQITLCSTIKGTVLRDTLRHELLHATWSLSGVGHAEGFPDEPATRAMDVLFLPKWEKMLRKEWEEHQHENNRK